jgi:rhamnose transport system permease protein
VRQSGRQDVKVIGLSLPSISKPYIHGGSVQTIFLWNTRNLGYLTVYAASLLAENKFPTGAPSLSAGRLGNIDVRDGQIVLGAPLLINKANIDSLDF